MFWTLILLTLGVACFLNLPPTPLQVSANTENSSISGYLNRSKGNKKHWKRLWFVIKNKVLYTYAASEVPSGSFWVFFFFFLIKFNKMLLLLFHLTAFSICRTWQRLRVSHSWASFFGRRKTDRPKSCSSSCITRTTCTTSSERTTSPPHRGTAVLL